MPKGRAPVHGGFGTVEYATWDRIIQRCENPVYHGYKNYGARGITICTEWRASFLAFLGDMGPRPSNQHSIDRIDNDRGYEPENCRWATHKEQQRNRGNNRRLTHNGETLCLSEWAERLGVNIDVIQQRLLRGWSIEKTVTTPKLRQKDWVREARKWK